MSKDYLLTTERHLCYRHTDIYVCQSRFFSAFVRLRAVLLAREAIWDARLFLKPISALNLAHPCMTSLIPGRAPLLADLGVFGVMFPGEDCGLTGPIGNSDAEPVFAAG